jgi:hypothetical protein
MLSYAPCHAMRCYAMRCCGRYMLSLADCSMHDPFFRTNTMRNLSSTRASAHFDYSDQTDSDVFVTLDSAVRPFIATPSPPHARLHGRLHGRTRAARVQADSQRRVWVWASPVPAADVGWGEAGPVNDRSRCGGRAQVSDAIMFTYYSATCQTSAAEEHMRLAHPSALVRAVCVCMRVCVDAPVCACGAPWSFRAVRARPLFVAPRTPLWAAATNASVSKRELWLAATGFGDITPTHVVSQVGRSALCRRSIQRTVRRACGSGLVGLAVVRACRFGACACAGRPRRGERASAWSRWRRVATRGAVLHPAVPCCNVSCRVATWESRLVAVHCASSW